MLRRTIASGLLAVVWGLGGCVTQPDKPVKLASIPDAFRGGWNEVVRECGPGGSDIQIDEHGVSYWESSSNFLIVRVLGPRHVKIYSDDYGEQTADSTPGSDYKGRHWREFILSEDGRKLTWRTASGGTFDYWRCTPASDEQSEGASEES